MLGQGAQAGYINGARVSWVTPHMGGLWIPLDEENNLPGRTTGNFDMEQSYRAKTKSAPALPFKLYNNVNYLIRANLIEVIR